MLTGASVAHELLKAPATSVLLPHYRRRRIVERTRVTLGRIGPGLFQICGDAHSASINSDQVGAICSAEERELSEQNTNFGPPTDHDRGFGQ
jgi:hypothetical protein